MSALFVFRGNKHCTDLRRDQIYRVRRVIYHARSVLPPFIDKGEKDITQ